MFKRLLILTTGLLVLTVAVAAIACGDDEPSEEEATADLCSDLEELGTAADALQEVDADTSVEDAEEARNDVEDAVEEVEAAAEDVAEARVDAVAQAFIAVDETIEGISGDDTLGDVAGSLLEDGAAILTAQENLVSELGC
jgi:hypothetical protein